MAATTESIIPAERIRQCIYLVRGQKVMLDSDLATLYGVETKALVRAAGGIDLTPSPNRGSLCCRAS